MASSVANARQQVTSALTSAGNSMGLQGDMALVVPSVLLGLAGYMGYRFLFRNKNALPAVDNIYSSAALPADTYDVAIIGAGPSGATAAFYLARNGKKVVLLEKAKFPRDKYCGDAITTLAQVHLKEMGVLQEMINEDETHWSQSGGFVSPGRESFIGNSAKELNRDTEGVVVAIKRIIMDEKVAMAAKRVGADLREKHEVNGADFDKTTGVWSIRTTKDDADKIVVKARVLISADGAPSRFAVQKGYVKTEPEGVCSRSYVKGNHGFGCDGLIFYVPALLPGYCAILRHAKNELGFCTYIIPGGPTQNSELREIHNKILTTDPWVSKTLSRPDLTIEPMKAGPLRLTPIPKSYDDNFLIIGDAAGFIDPLTGEGIQYAMQSGKYAADVVYEGLIRNDVSAHQLRKYQEKWYSDWGREFYWSMKMSLLLYRFPIMLDAAASLINKRGANFLKEWAMVMTGQGSKTWFLRPDVGPFLFVEAISLLVKRAFGYGRKQ